MAIRVTTATARLTHSIMDAKLKLLHARLNLQRATFIAGLVAAALAANISDADASKYHRHSAASTPKNQWLGDYAPLNPNRHDRAAPPPFRDVEPHAGRGVFEDHPGI